MIQFRFRRPVGCGAVDFRADHRVVAEAVDLILVEMICRAIDSCLWIIVFQTSARSGKVEVVEDFQTKVAAAELGKEFYSARIVSIQAFTFDGFCIILPEQVIQIIEYEQRDAMRSL